MGVLSLTLLRGIFLLDAIKRTQDDSESGSLTVAALPDNAGPQCRWFYPRSGSLDTSRLANQARRDAKHWNCDVVDPHTSAPSRTQQPARQREWKYVAREFRQLATAVFQQAFVRRDPGMIGAFGLGVYTPNRLLRIGLNRRKIDNVISHGASSFRIRPF